jgi:hypothetical protein
MLKFYKLINFKHYIFLCINLLIHFIKIKTNRYIITTLNTVEITKLTDNNISDYYSTFFWSVIIWNLGNILINFINKVTYYKIKSYIINKISKTLYLQSINQIYDKKANKNTDNLEKCNNNLNLENEKHEIQLFDNSQVLDRIYERLLFTIPKILIFVFFYLYCLMNFSFYILCITFIFNFIGVFIIKKINNIKKNIFKKIYDYEVDIKNEHINFIKSNDKESINKIKILFDSRNKDKNLESIYNHSGSLFTELFSDILMCIVFCYGFNFLVPNSINNMKPIELMYTGINSCNFMNYIIELIDSYNNHKQDMIQLGELKELVNDSTN